MYGTDTGLLALGLIPALLASVLLLAVLIVLIVFIGDLSSAVTWFANGWPPDARDTVRILAGISLFGIFGLLAVVTFTSVTLAIGDPFYEKISERVEKQLDARGGPDVVPPRADLPWWTEFRRGIAESIRMIAVSAMIGIPLFVAGFIPGIGQTVVPAIGALVGGWFIAVELVGIPFTRRGLRLADRRRILRSRRPLAVGFGAAVFICFLIPLGAILVTPAAVAGGTMLARRVLSQPGQRGPVG
jgi:CysZ protein